MTGLDFHPKNFFGWLMYENVVFCLLIEVLLYTTWCLLKLVHSGVISSKAAIDNFGKSTIVSALTRRKFFLPSGPCFFFDPGLKLILGMQQ